MVKCASCGKEIDEKEDIMESERKPCPNCGSIGRALVRIINENISIVDRFRMKMKGALLRRGRPSRELIQGHDLHRKSGIWMLLMRLIDRENNLYHEKVISIDTGEIVHECKEKLSDHSGHGSAKKKH